MAMTPEDTEKVQKLIDQSFLQYDDRTKGLVTLAYEKAKNETIDLLRQENASSFKNIEAAANAKIQQMDEKMESDTLIVDAKLAVILEEKKKSDEKFDYLNTMQMKAQEEMTKLREALEATKNEFTRMQVAGQNLENAS